MLNTMPSYSVLIEIAELRLESLMIWSFLFYESFSAFERFVLSDFTLIDNLMLKWRRGEKPFSMNFEHGFGTFIFSKWMNEVINQRGLRSL